MTAGLIYGCADVAQLLRVTPSAVSNYRSRFDDTPAPAYLTTSGRPYWTVEGMAAWQSWRDARQKDVRVTTTGRKDAYDAVEDLRKKITS